MCALLSTNKRKYKESKNYHPSLKTQRRTYGHRSGEYKENRQQDNYKEKKKFSNHKQNKTRNTTTETRRIDNKTGKKNKLILNN